MITGELKNKVDKIWEIFWTGGITNPLEVIEQFNYLLFIKQLDEVETRKERDANILGIPYEGIFPADCQLIVNIWEMRSLRFQRQHYLPK